MAKSVSVQGSVELRAANGQWHKVSLGDTFCPGNMIRIGANSRASLVLNNDTILRLDQHTTLTLSGLDKKKATSIDLLEGIAHFISRVKQSFKVITPFVNAAIEGTEFVISVDKQQTQLTVFEGQVAARNTKGEVLLTSGQSAIAGKGQAPVLHVVAKPRDVVQWALYYPPILAYQTDHYAHLPTKWQQRLQKSNQAQQQGDINAALSEIHNLPETLRDANLYTYRASLRLGAGRVVEAQADLEHALSLDPQQSQAMALKAIIAIVKNNKTQGLVLAQQAVAIDPEGAAPQLALSYAHQAAFDIDAALAVMVQSVKTNPDNALAWARVAELHLASGDLDKAVEAAQQATEKNPQLARTQSVLGFAYLTRIEVEKAKQAFTKAMQQDQTDPLSRLGFGLAIIRQGELAAGRREIEYAASLDPNNALIRSYLGKAYFEEKRNKHAASQLAMAKELDPNDPTAWFYDAIRKQSENRPVEALGDLEKSIELNDNRAVYRSQLLLDQDEAARSTSLARIYNDLGFQQLALVEGWKSVNADPGNHSAHRFLADSYAALPRHEVARVSELLQAQLLQPINLDPIQPQLAETGLGILDGAGPSALTFNEYNPLFVRNRTSVNVNTIVGGNDTRGNDFVVSGVWDNNSLSLGQFHYESDGFRANNDQKQNIQNAFFQSALTNDTSVQFEYRNFSLTKGDLPLVFDSTDFSSTSRESKTTKTTRVGLNHRLDPNSKLLLSALENEINIRQIEPGTFPATDATSQQDGDIVELQYLYNMPWSKLIFGAGKYKSDLRDDITLDFSPFPCLLTSCLTTTITDVKHRNGYIYANIAPAKGITYTVGLSKDSVRNQFGSQSKLNPKLGLIWDINNSTSLRMAAFHVQKRNLIANQTLEPTQIAGFSQFFDDTTSTDSKRYGLALDKRNTAKLHSGIEISKRDLEVPYLESGVTNWSTWEERFSRAYLYWTPMPWLSASIEYQYERFRRHDISYNLGVLDLKTHSVPLSVNFFETSEFNYKLTATYYNQKGTFYKSTTATTSFGDDHFWLVDASLNYRLPKTAGMMSLGVKNLFNEKFQYHDMDTENPDIIPEQLIFSRISLSF